MVATGGLVFSSVSFRFSFSSRAAGFSKVVAGAWRVFVDDSDAGGGWEGFGFDTGVVLAPPGLMLGLITRRGLRPDIVIVSCIYQV